MKTTLRIIELLLALALVISCFSACGNGGASEPKATEITDILPTDGPAPTEEPVIVSDDETIARLGLVNVGREVAVSAETVMTVEEDAATIYVKDYGAVGDGETNDQKAISKAISDLKKQPKGSKLQFEEGKVYYCGKSGTALTLSAVKDKIIDGNNSTILIDAPAKFLDMQSCKATVLTGFNFNYKKKPYAVSTTVSDIDTKKKTAVITFDRSLGISKTYSAPSAEFFGVLSRDDGRYHMSITKIEIENADTNTYKITFNDTFGHLTDRIEALSTYAFICPMPNVGHSVEVGFSVYSNENVTIKNCNVYSFSKFGFHVRLNDGVVLFENVNMVADPSENNENVRIVGWRDGFHCKENRAQLIWKNCTFEWEYDDIINISASLLKVTEVDGSGYVHIMWPESGGAYGNIKKGDIMSFYSPSTGEMVGSSVVTKVSGDKFLLEDSLEGIKKDVVAVDNSLGAPNSEIISSALHGTLRFRSPMYIVDSTIWCTRMWIGMENVGTTSGEGPLTENILFSNCNFIFDDESGPYIHIVCGNTKGASKLKKETAAQDQIYHVKNIVFRNCNINTDMIELADVHKNTSDTVIVEKEP